MNLTNLSIPLLFILFATGAIAIWFAGIQLSKATDVLASRFHLGEALGGIILLAIVTNLPEIAIVISASMHHNMEMAVGNILGGIALQTVVLVVLDAFGIGKKSALTYCGSSLVLVLEGVMVIVLLTLVVIGHQMPANIFFWRMSPVGIFIFIFWIIGIVLIGKAQKHLPWKEVDDVEKSKAEGQKDKKDKQDNSNKIHTGKTIAIFLVCSAVTLIAGTALEESGNVIANNMGMQGVIFGATVLAAATSLPEISTGLASMKLGDYEMAVSDIFGGNAFLPVLFLLATLCSGKPVLPMAQKTDIYLTGLGMLLTSVYLFGLIFKNEKQIFRIGVDSFVVLMLYLIGMSGLFFF